jgi:hypothetical protein
MKISPIDRVSEPLELPHPSPQRRFEPSIRSVPPECLADPGREGVHAIRCRRLREQAAKRLDYLRTKKAVPCLEYRRFVNLLAKPCELAVEVRRFARSFTHKSVAQPVADALLQGSADQKQYQLDTGIGDVDAVLGIKAAGSEYSGFPRQTIALEMPLPECELVVKVEVYKLASIMVAAEIVLYRGIGSQRHSRKALESALG